MVSGHRYLIFPLIPSGSVTACRRRPLGRPNYRRQSANYRHLRSRCQHEGKMRTGSASLVRSLPFCWSAGSQVRILPRALIKYQTRHMNVWMKCLTIYFQRDHQKQQHLSHHFYQQTASWMLIIAHPV